MIYLFNWEKSKNKSSHISHHSLVYSSKNNKTQQNFIQNFKIPDCSEALIMSSLGNVSRLQLYHGLGAQVSWWRTCLALGFRASPKSSSLGSHAYNLSTLGVEDEKHKVILCYIVS